MVVWFSVVVVFFLTVYNEVSCKSLCALLLQEYFITLNYG